LPFLTRVWPRQRAIRTARSSEALAGLAFGLTERFAEIVKAILPNLATVTPSAMLVSPMVDEDKGLVSHSAGALLDLLWAILADGPMNWPYGTTNLLAALAEHPETRADSRLAELRRRESLG